VSGRSQGPDALRLAVDMSELDRAIVRALQLDGRRSYSSVARELGVAEKTVRRRVEHLRTSGVIDITTVTDPELLGYDAIALVGVDLDGTRPASDIAAALAALDAVDYVVVTTGRYDLLVEVVCRDAAELMETVQGGIACLAGVSKTEVFPYLSFHYQEPRWEAAHGKNADAQPVTSHLSLDDLDRAILEVLNADGRAPLQRIARTLEVSLTLVRQRVARMVGSGAVRVMAITNPASLGFRTLAWLGIRGSSGTRIQELADRIAAIPSIAYLVICAGRFDIFAEAICVDRLDLLHTLDDEVRRLPGIASVECFIYLDLRYKRLRPL
jgi:DNA-binding Lrp family transcriptional regulator